MTWRSPRRRGVVLVLVALCLVAMLGVVAMAVDGGLIMDQRRRVQATADAAALAAAIGLYTSYAKSGTYDTVAATNSAKSVAAANGYSNATVNIPPASGSFANKAGYAEVIIQFNQTPGFGQIFSSGTILVSARAVATGRFVPLADGMIILDPSSQGALNLVGNATIDVTSGSIIVDTTNAAGATFKGNGSLTAPSVDLSGNPGYSVSGGNVTLNTTIQSSQPPVADPLSWLPAPNRSSLGVQSTTTLKITSNNPVTLNPGVYIGGISISGQANVTLNPGIYYMQGGGFSITGNSKSMVTGSGVMIYNDGGGSINIAGQGTVTLSPPTSGIYMGITIFQNRASAQTVQVTGNGSTNISGTFYAANAPLVLTGNGSSANVLGSQYISYDLTLTGNGTIDTTLESAPRPLVRVFGLVE